MNRCDFIFRGETLSSHGYLMCEFEGSGSVAPVVTDSQREFSSIKMYGGKYFPIIFSVYNNAFVAEMSICKIDESTNYVITPGEAAELKRWLCSPYASEFRLCDSDYVGIFWNGTFNVEEIHSEGRCVGLKLTFQTTAPFGYKDAIISRGSLLKNGFVNIYDTSDEEGYIYPDLKITLKSAGELKITNSFDGRETIIKNCNMNEVITFSHLQQVMSSDKNHIIGDDFNFKFVRICNTYNNTLNRLTFSLPCDYVLSYNPIAKVVI